MTPFVGGAGAGAVCAGVDGAVGDPVADEPQAAAPIPNHPNSNAVPHAVTASPDFRTR
jgi:hypothetical protein